MAATPERPGFLLAWIAGVTVCVGVVVHAPLRPGPRPAPAFPLADASDEVAPAGGFQPGLPFQFSTLPIVSQAGATEVVQARVEQPFFVLGRVVDPTLEPCSGARLELRYAEEAAAPAQAVAASDGQFRLGPLARRGLALLTASHKDCRLERSLDLSAAAGDLVVGTVRLERVLLSSAPPTAASAPTLTASGPRKHPALSGDGPAPWILFPPLPARREERRESRVQPRTVELQVQMEPEAARLWFTVWFEDDGLVQDKLAAALKALPDPVVRELRRHARHRRHRDRGGYGGDGGDGGDGGLPGRDWILDRVSWLREHPGVLQFVLELEPQEILALARAWWAAHNNSAGPRSG